MRETFKSPIPIAGYDRETSSRIASGQSAFLRVHPYAARFSPLQFGLEIAKIFLNNLDRDERDYYNLPQGVREGWLKVTTLPSIRMRDLRPAFVTGSFIFYLAESFPFEKVIGWKDLMARYIGIDLDLDDPGIFDPWRGKEVELKVMKEAGEEWATPEYIEARRKHMNWFIIDKEIRTQIDQQAEYDLGHGRMMKNWLDDFELMQGERPDVSPQLTEYKPY